MTVIIYLVCFSVAGIVQSLLRLLLSNGAVPAIPETVIIYGIALWVASSWSKAYNRKKEEKEKRVAEEKDSVEK